jgi:hypothetical protein
MLCAKCQKNEATVHLTTIVEGTQSERIDLCKDCAPAMTGLQSFDPKDLQALSVVGKKCEFCGQAACSGQIVAAGSTVYWCLDCSQEFGRILSDLITSERPDLMKRAKEESSFFALASDLEVQAWLQEANDRAMGILKNRRQQDDRDKSS